MKITLNPTKNEQLELSTWQVNDEPARVSADFKGMSYELIFSEEGPYVEIWSLDSNREPEALFDTIRLPFYEPFYEKCDSNEG